MEESINSESEAKSNKLQQYYDHCHSLIDTMVVNTKAYRYALVGLEEHLNNNNSNNISNSNNPNTSVNKSTKDKDKENKNNNEEPQDPHEYVSLQLDPNNVNLNPQIENDIDLFTYRRSQGLSEEKRNNIDDI